MLIRSSLQLFKLLLNLFQIIQIPITLLLLLLLNLLRLLQRTARITPLNKLLSRIINIRIRSINRLLTINLHLLDLNLLRIRIPHQLPRRSHKPQQSIILHPKNINLPHNTLIILPLRRNRIQLDLHVHQTHICRIILFILVFVFLLYYLLPRILLAQLLLLLSKLHMVLIRLIYIVLPHPPPLPGNHIVLLILNLNLLTTFLIILIFTIFTILFTILPIILIKIRLQTTLRRINRQLTIILTIIIILNLLNNLPNKFPLPQRIGHQLENLQKFLSIKILLTPLLKRPQTYIAVKTLVILLVNPLNILQNLLLDLQQYLRLFFLLIIISIRIRLLLLRLLLLSQFLLLQIPTSSILQILTHKHYHLLLISTAIFVNLVYI